MTGIFLFAIRDGKRRPIELEHLTDEERQEKLGNDPQLIGWLNAACHDLVKAELLINTLKAIVEKRE